MMFSGFIHTVAPVCVSFLWQSNIGCMDGPHIIHPSVDGHSGCFPLLAAVSNSVKGTVCKFLFGRLLFILLGTYQGAELLGRVGILCVIY